MNSTKNLLAAVTLIAACAISQPVLADVTESAAQPALNTLALESTDLSFAFEHTSQPLQMATLSEQEMQETEGARFNFFVDMYRNTSFYGPSPGLWHGDGRIVGVVYNRQPVFRLDYGPNPSPANLHLHFGSNVNLHRPWYAPWKTY